MEELRKEFSLKNFEIYEELKKIFKKKILESNNFEKELINLENDEKYLLKSEEQKFQDVLKLILKSNFDYTKEIEAELHNKTFLNFSSKYNITLSEFETVFNLAKEEKLEEYYSSPEIKKIILDVKGELPLISARVYNIANGLYTKANGEELTLKEYSDLNNEDYETNKKILTTAKKIINVKVKRRLKDIQDAWLNF